MSFHKLAGDDERIRSLEVFPNLPSQIPTSQLLRRVTVQGIEREGYISTCTVTSAIYAWYYAQGWGQDYMAEHIEAATRYLIETHVILYPLPSNEYVYLYSVSAPEEYLQGGRFSPVFPTLSSRDDPYGQWGYTREWLEQGGTLYAGDNHMFCIRAVRTDKGLEYIRVEPADGKQYPFSEAEFNAIHPATVRLLPPYVGRLTPRMRELIEANLQTHRNGSSQLVIRDGSPVIVTLSSATALWKKSFDLYDQFVAAFEASRPEVQIPSQRVDVLDHAQPTNGPQRHTPHAVRVSPQKGARVEVQKPIPPKRISITLKPPGNITQKKP